jgi:hypothetical protein
MRFAVYSLAIAAMFVAVCLAVAAAGTVWAVPFGFAVLAAGIAMVAREGSR